MNHEKYLDRINYDQVANLGEWPIYQPLERIEDGNWWGDNFNCDESQLIINGGGPFEQPVIIAVNPNRIVCEYIISYGLEMSENDPDGTAWYTQYFDDVLHPVINTYINVNEPKFIYPGAIPESYSEIIKHCQEASIQCPLNSDDMILEEWLCCSLGEFIWFDYPEICKPLIEQLKPIISHINKRMWPNISLYQDN
ncbi:MAG: hypothetical protein JXR16_05440 [Bermanella sp.]